MSPQSKAWAVCEKYHNIITEFEQPSSTKVLRTDELCIKRTGDGNVVGPFDDRAAVSKDSDFVFAGRKAQQILVYIDRNGILKAVGERFEIENCRRRRSDLDGVSAAKDRGEFGRLGIEKLKISFAAAFAIGVRFAQFYPLAVVRPNVELHQRAVERSEVADQYL